MLKVNFHFKTLTYYLYPIYGKNHSQSIEKAMFSSKNMAFSIDYTEGVSMN